MFDAHNLDITFYLNLCCLAFVCCSWQCQMWKIWCTQMEMKFNQAKCLSGDGKLPGFADWPLVQWWLTWNRCGWWVRGEHGGLSSWRSVLTRESIDIRMAFVNARGTRSLCQGQSLEDDKLFLPISIYVSILLSYNRVLLIYVALDKCSVDGRCTRVPRYAARRRHKLLSFDSFRDQSWNRVCCFLWDA